MKSKNFMVIILAVAIGVLLGKVMIDQYDKKQNIIPAFASGKETLYFLQQGVYSSKESMEKNTTDLVDYIYTIDDDLYHVYVGITKNEKNKDKLAGYFKDMGYIIYVKEIAAGNEMFLASLEQFDVLLEKTEDKKAIATICRQVMNKYEELVVNSEHQNEGNTG